MTARLALILIAAAAAAQTPPAAPAEQQRDLKFTREPAAPVVKPGDSVVIPRSYALVIGISEYPNLPPQGQLRFPARDAAAIYAALISPEGGQFPPENVRRLIGKDATLANIRQALEQWLPSVSKDDDRVVIYFAGHGFVAGGKAYLAPYDIDPNDIPGTSYSMEKLGRVIGADIKAKWKVLLTDACHSGAITPEADTRQINASLLQLDRSLFSLTASRDREQSFESEIWGGGHGVFTYYLIKGIEGEADENADGVVTADELDGIVAGGPAREGSAKLERLRTKLERLRARGADEKLLARLQERILRLEAAASAGSDGVVVRTEARARGDTTSTTTREAKGGGGGAASAEAQASSTGGRSASTSASASVVVSR